MKRSGSADLPLHYGHVPPWLAERMSKLGFAIVETIILEYGNAEVLRRLSDPFWFQSLGAVMGMDWHSSGITTSVMGALKKAINPHSRELGIYICGGKGKASRNTPLELLRVGDHTGIDANYLIRCSKLSAKVDNTAIQDGFQLYMHSFIVNNNAEWAVVQQGMSAGSSTARRYHWHSPTISSFVEEPHAYIYGQNQGDILNLVARQSATARTVLMEITQEAPPSILKEAQKLVMPAHHDVKVKDIDLKRLGTILWLAQEKRPSDFEELLLLEGLGPRTLQSLALVSEIIYGAPSRFRDPARFSFAHGGKDGHPFPVPIKVYDESITVLQDAVERSKLGFTEKAHAIKRLSKIAAEVEKDFLPNTNFEGVIQKERADSCKYGGRTIFGDVSPPVNRQLKLF